MAALGSRLSVSPTLGECSVAVDDVSMTYKTTMSSSTASSTSSVPMRGIKRSFRDYLKRSQRQKVYAVRKVSFIARTGESIGLLGSNGAGKSTLLRMIAGAETPTSGKILANSQPQLLGVSAALVPALTGIRNIGLGCLAMGLTPSEVKKVTPNIIELAGIGDSIYRPMQTYSSGMSARLRFAISAASQPDILLIDEALGTGDATFAAKASQILAEIQKAAGTIFVVSHAAETIENMCTRALWMHNGEIIADGPAKETARKYRWWAHQLAQGEDKTAGSLLQSVKDSYTPTCIDWMGS